MGRGGKRAGTGPKAILGEDAFFCRIAIGTEFERRWRNLSLWQARARQRSAAQGAELAEDLAKVNSIHPLLIRKYDGKQVRQIVIELAQTPDHQWPDSTPDFIVEAAHASRNRAVNITNVHMSERSHRQAVRPQGFRDRLIAKVAAWATRKYGERITPRFVRGCIEDYRRFLKN